MSLARVTVTSASTTSPSVSRRASSMNRPSASNFSCACPTATSPSTTRAAVAASTLRSSAWAQTAPNAPMLAPTTATGLFRSGFVASGREAQSIAFLSWPGTEWLYSGVAMRIASAPAIASRRSVTAAGAGSTSSSSSYGGTAFSPSQSSSSTPSGRSSAAAWSRLLLWESRRRLPEMPRTFIVLLLHQEEVCGQLHVVRERRLPVGELHLPVDAERAAVDGRLEVERHPLGPGRMRERVADRAFELDGNGHALQSQLAADRDVLARAADLGRLEPEERSPLGVKEVRREEVRGQVLVQHVDAVRAGLADEGCGSVLGDVELGLERRERAAEDPARVADLEADVGVDRILAPGTGREGLLCLCQSVHRSLLSCRYT